MSNEATRSGDELERLERTIERMEQQAQLATLSAPWWRKGGTIAAVTAIVAAVVPVTTAIQEHFETQSELVLQQAKQEHDMRMAYLERYEVPGRRLQTLRFLLATSTDPRLLAWAREEQELVQGQLEEIDEQLAVVTKRLALRTEAQTIEELKEQRDELLRLKEVTRLRPPPEVSSAVRTPR
jgi:hypothetical protein